MRSQRAIWEHPRATRRIAHRRRADPAIKRVAKFQPVLTRPMLEGKGLAVRPRAANAILARTLDVREHTQLADHPAALEQYSGFWMESQRKKS
jgi:hypothetical protein